MKQAEITDKVMAGQKLLVGEWRESDLKTFARNGESATVHTDWVLVGREMVLVERWLGRGEQAAPRQWKRGQPVVIEWSSWAQGSCGIRCRGTVHVLER